MSNYARERGLDVDQVRQSGENVREMAGAYRELAIDVGLAVGGAVPGVGWGADAISLGRSISKGDGWGVVFDLIGFVPLLGDAAKGGKIINKARALRKVLDSTMSGLARVFRKTEDVAADFWKSKRNMAAYNDAMKGCGKPDCFNAAALHKGPQYRNTPTSNGKWQPPTGRGDGKWTPDEGTPLHDFLQSQKPPRDSITYENGFPKFDEFSRADVKIPMTGDHAKDFDIADNLYRKQIDNPDWKRPEGMTWHHKEDGTTMQLVPSALNNNAGHSGGAALFKGDRPVGQEF